KQAVPLLRKAAAESALAIEARYLRGIVYFESGDFSEVAAPLSDLLDSSYSEHALLLEGSHRLTHRAEEAQQAFHQLNTRFPDSPWVDYHWKDRALDKAEPWLPKELSIQPCHALACYCLAEMARTGGNSGGATDLYRRSIASEDRNAKAHLGLGIVLSGLEP